MLDKKKIEEARKNIQKYLNEGMIRKEVFNKIVYDVLIKNSRESLDTANFLLNNKKSTLWVIVSSYYSMFYIANAVIYKMGYKILDKIPHKITSDALVVFVKDKLRSSLLDDYEESKEEALLLAKTKAEGLIEKFDMEREKRGNIQYETIESDKLSKAETSLRRAKEFIHEMEKLLIGLN
jgi:uncharacterized protein (UPF0332 family)